MKKRFFCFLREKNKKFYRLRRASLPSQTAKAWPAHRFKLDSQIIKNEKGLAYVELLPMLVIFVILFGLTFGLWTSIHKASLKSIAARHYSFEVLNNRTHYIYHRDIIPLNGKKSYYQKNGMRFFANVEYQKDSTNPKLKADQSNLSLFDSGVSQIYPPNPKNSSFRQTNPIKIKTGYGICIDNNNCKVSLPP